MNEGIKITVELITKWKEQGQIEEVFRIDNELIVEDFDDITE